jgi:hypothetical protein
VATAAAHTTAYPTGFKHLTVLLLLATVTFLQVDMLYGRKIQAVPEQVRWIQSFTVSEVLLLLLP